MKVPNIRGEKGAVRGEGKIDEFNPTDTRERNSDH